MSDADEVIKLKNHITEIYELIAGHDAVNRLKPCEMIDYIKVLNEQIAEWQELDEIVKTISKIEPRMDHYLNFYLSQSDEEVKSE